MLFLTLTYDDQHLSFDSQGNGCVVKRDVQLFLKKLRKKTPKIRYYLVAEYGTRTYRPHYHVILFGIDATYADIIAGCWIHGNIFCGTVTIRSIKYCAKYHVNRGHYPTNGVPPFVLMSLHPAIGSGYINRMIPFHAHQLQNSYYPDFSQKKRLPRYYKNKLYTPDERQTLAMAFEDNYSLKAYNEFKAQNPRGNFFLNRLASVQSFEANFREKSNFNNKL